ncbi:Uncharacterized protein MCB1EB_1303 [Mycoavidus cysteinexigens]|uniref:Uncharacterized protein n=1 Tax=Mycoavidus cysteinexigens TaxID=1553431 RepID=A0A2Z6EVI4_9BURK|nr:putative phage tail assembly chaperone [Mycoavidus cysteinexigens]BBE09464.1 Uncharacterized protein MCB1EB_1303 [Mycoavidus cysteinexigens]GAM51782.1 hypothetical protein EBME_0245 [bacterium endosymbiont of Mortierella elongata FMR23-6]GLR01286.1 hypothetical protein GCM10007934_10980 [Mycoavidus cysteinexigens]
MNTHQFELDSITYRMTPANAMAGWTALKQAGKLLEGIKVSQESHLEIGTLLAHLGSPQVAEIERLIYEHTTVQANQDKPFRLAHQLETHFNQHRSHLIRILLEGCKVQFADFFKGGAWNSLSALMPTPVQT